VSCFTGWLVDRVSVSWVMAIGFFLWSAATSATGFLHGFTALMGVRLVLGIGESVAYPAYSKILAKLFPGRPTRFRELNHCLGAGLRPRLRHVAGRCADVPVWLAVLFCGPRFHQSGLALAVTLALRKILAE
jgi:MFS family permease